MRAKKENKREIKRKWYCEETKINFFNFENYFKHQQRVREWYNLVPRAIDKALEMLQVTYPEIEVIANNFKYEIYEGFECCVDPMEHVDLNIKLKYKGKEFETSTFYLKGKDITCATNIYFNIIRYYILPAEAGFNSFEEWELSKLPISEQEAIKEQLYRNYYIATEVE